MIFASFEKIFTNFPKRTNSRVLDFVKSPKITNFRKSHSKIARFTLVAIICILNRAFITTHLQSHFAVFCGLTPAQTRSTLVILPACQDKWEHHHFCHRLTKYTCIWWIYAYTVWMDVLKKLSSAPQCDSVFCRPGHDLNDAQVSSSLQQG